MSEVRAEYFDVAGDPGAWRAVGLHVADDGMITLMGTSLRIRRRTESSSSSMNALTATVSSHIDSEMQCSRFQYSLSRHAPLSGSKSK